MMSNMPQNSDTAFVNCQIISSDNLDIKGGLIVENGLISDFGPHINLNYLRENNQNINIVDGQDKLLIPGFIDMQVFTGEPGFEYRETLETASYAAAAGGVTTIITMPNTLPVIDDAALVDFILRRARDTAIVNIYPVAALTKGLKGEEITEFGLLKSAGAIAFSDGDIPITDSLVLYRALSYSCDFNALIINQPNESSLSKNGVINEGEISTRLGLTGIPAIAETIMLERDLRLVELTGAKYHANQISCRESLEVIRNAKKNGLKVTCGVSINHLLLNENDVGAYRTFFKLMPPLRSESDRQAMLEGVADGSIDVIVSGHNPQDADTKRLPFSQAAFGAVGLETMAAGIISLHYNNGIAIEKLFKALTYAPAKILGVNSGKISKGAKADLILLDPDRPWQLTLDNLKSKSKNTPFEGHNLQGVVLKTLVAGETVYNNEY